jgi:hypothetical protein
MPTFKRGGISCTLQIVFRQPRLKLDAVAAVYPPTRSIYSPTPPPFSLQHDLRQA